MSKRWLFLVAAVFSVVATAYGQNTPFVEVDKLLYSGRQDPYKIVTDSGNPNISTLANYLENLPPAPPPTWPNLGSRGYDLQNYGALNFPAEEVVVFNGTIQKYSSDGTYAFFQDVGCESCSCPTKGKCLESFLDKVFSTPPSEDEGSQIEDQLLPSGEYIVGFSLPINGYEPTYNPPFWNSDLKSRVCNNCYNYAGNIKNNQWAQPGVAGGKEFTMFTCADVLQAAARDGLIPWSADDKCPNFDYKVALVVDPDPTDPDYHWYRQDSNGDWSHKPGETAVKNVDESGKKITDPRTADRGGYTNFCAFMCVRARDPNIMGNGKIRIFRGANGKIIKIIICP